jgi:hypothetical protein
MNLLIPGRHHLLTNFQFRYLFRFSQAGLENGEPLDAVIFAVTSANHSGTRRNPLPLLARAIQIQLFGQGLDAGVYVYGVPDAGERPDFADLVLKTIAHESSGLHELTPKNTVVAGSTGVMDLYRALGFSVFAAEEETGEPLPWEFVERIASHGLDDAWVLDGVHPASIRTWRQYGWSEKLRLIFDDPLVGGDGDLTETRDYATYVRQMDENMDLKFGETEPFVVPGRVGDIGCAVGSWIKKASFQSRLRESDFYGIELARPLYEICRQRKENGEFGTPHVFFSQKNAVTGLCFPRASMNCVHTGSLTHEIWSYGGPEALEQFLSNRFDELAPGGVWVNRDVVGCLEPEELVYLELPDPGLRTLFRRFVDDFRPGEPRIVFETKTQDGTLIRLRRRDAQEFLMHKDYTDNWQSEMKETFTHWTWDDWVAKVRSRGFAVHPLSRTYTNPWIRDHRWAGQVRLWNDGERTVPSEWFPTTMVLAAVKP